MSRKGRGVGGGEALSQDSQQPLSSPTWSVSPGGTLRRAASQGGQVLRSGCAWGGTFSCRPKGTPKASIPGAGGLGEGGRPRISPGLLAGPSGVAPFLLGFLGLCGDSLLLRELSAEGLSGHRAWRPLGTGLCIWGDPREPHPRLQLPDGSETEAGWAEGGRQAAPSRPREQNLGFLRL